MGVDIPREPQASHERAVLLRSPPELHRNSSHHFGKYPPLHKQRVLLHRGRAKRHVDRHDGGVFDLRMLDVDEFHALSESSTGRRDVEAGVWGTVGAMG